MSARAQHRGRREGFLRAMTRAGVGTSLVAILGLVALTFAAGPGQASATTTQARPLAASSGSALTESGSGSFSALKVTVSQTQDLVNQVVNVTWTGATPTQPAFGGFGINYMQIMQCWGDASTGPTREQCEFGAGANILGGSWTTSRQTTYGTLVDPAETYTVPPGSYDTANVPFDSVTGTVETDGNSSFYDSYTTNEIDYGRTRSDGTGQEYFQVDTGVEASGLGCGEPEKVGSSTRPRGCWLVVVPRGDTEVDGSVRSATGINRLVSSPLSATNWAQRVVFPLGFTAVGQNCPISAVAEPTSGEETALEAVTRWQPTLCANNGPVFGYTQLSADVSRSVLASTAPNLQFLSRPLDATDGTPAGKPVYAPIAVSGISIAFLVERQTPPTADAAVKASDGVRMTTLNLTPRLVAKLLTESYREAVTNDDTTYLANNPLDLTTDPDFIAANPSFSSLDFINGISNIIVPTGTADAYYQLWQWVWANADARAFMQGKADPYGETVNPHYKTLTFPTSSFPKAEPGCRTFPLSTIPRPPLCELDEFPYTISMHAGAQAVSGGSTGAKDVWDPTATPAAYKAAPPEFEGSRGLLVLADTPTAIRYGLNTASLQNADGQFVGPTTSSITAGLKTFKADSAGVLEPVATTKVSGAYPLTNITYAATAPSELMPASAHDYAKFLRYAIGSGQTLGVAPGSLPYGYVPLTSALKAQTTAVANQLAAVTKSSSTPLTMESVNASNGLGGSSSATTGGTSSANSQTTSNEAAPAASNSATQPSSTSPAGDVLSLTPAAVRSPSVPLGAVRFALVGALLIGGIAAGAGPLLMRASQAAA
jgi:PBP superfamily domain